jgi:hypothetical protein
MLLDWLASSHVVPPLQFPTFGPLPFSGTGHQMMVAQDVPIPAGLETDSCVTSSCSAPGSAKVQQAAKHQQHAVNLPEVDLLGLLALNSL